MIDREDSEKLELVLKKSEQLLDLMVDMSTIDRKSLEYNHLEKNVDQLYQQTKGELEQLNQKPEVQQFMDELNVKDVAHERNELIYSRGEFLLIDHIDEKIKEDVNMTPDEKNDLGKKVTAEFSKINKFADKRNLTDLKKNVQSHVSKSKMDKSTLKSAIADMDNLERIRDIAMGDSPDYMGSTKIGLGTGQRFQGVLGEVSASMELLRSSLDTDNDKNAYFAKSTAISAKPILNFVSVANQNRNNFNPSPVD